MTIDVTVTDSITGEAVPDGTVEVYVDNEIVATGEIIEGKVTIPVNITEIGTYDIDIKYTGNENYSESKDLLEDVEIVGRDATITPTVTNNTFANTSVVVNLVDTVTGEPISNADIIVTLPDGTNITTVTDNEGAVEISVDLPVGDSNITVTYPGDDTYNAINTSILITVDSRDSTTNAIVSDNVAGDVMVKVEVTDAVTGMPVPNGPVEIVVDGTVVGRGEITDGEVTIPVDIIESGVYDIEVHYLGNVNYTASNKTLSDVTIVGSESNVTVEQGNTTVGNTTVNVTVVDPETDEPIVNATVIITLPNGTEVTGTTNEKGGVIIPVDLPVGDSNITVTYPGDETYNDTSITVPITVEPRESVTDAEVLNNTLGDVNIAVNVTDATTGEVVPDGPVEVIVNGAVVGTGEVADGIANIPLDIDKAGTYDITIRYNGNSNYTESEITLDDVTIIPRDDAITAEEVDNTVNHTQVNITLTDPVTKEVISNAPIEIYNNGTLIANATTGSDGSVLVDIDLPAGNYTLDVRFTGDEIYESTSQDCQ